ncbi:MAG: hypothetical protein JSV13_08020 [Nitrospiraceae bacterium]|jgi:hypothetical protein|nr:MAG: hypothetical protein JSV13_08020 [Nitrospiraceae bacterium]
MKIEGVKIYGICLERLQHQIMVAKSRIEKENLQDKDRIELECYNTGEIDDIVDILELYDIKDEGVETLKEKLKELADDVAIFIRETIEFGFSDNGHLSLYLRLKK